MREDDLMSVTNRTPGGRPLVILGDEAVVTMDRWNLIRDRLDSDPRIVSCSLVYEAPSNESWIRSPRPSGLVTVVATDVADLIGDPPQDRSETDSWQRWLGLATRRGLWHDWLVSDAVDLSTGSSWISDAELTIDDDASSSLAHARDAGPSGRLSVAVDATWLGPYETGAQVLTTHALAALAERPEISKINLVGLHELPAYAKHLADNPTIRLAAGADAVDRADIVWYPNQIDARIDLARARNLGRRVVITYLDFIAYDIPAYHASTNDWFAYREQQRAAALLADGITTISSDVAARLIQEVPLLDSARVQAIGLGVDHIEAGSTPLEPPSHIGDLVVRLSERPFILVLGNDFLHKNRDFAIRTWMQLLEQGTSCDLVLAGLHVHGSSSKESEKEVLTGHVNLRGEVHTFGHIDAPTKCWLMEHAAAVHYPSSAEGFGFVPYEAAAFGTPTTFTAFGPLREFLPHTTAPRRWNLAEHAADLATLLGDDTARKNRLQEITQARDTLTWRHYAECLVRHFTTTAEAAPVVSSVLPDSGGGLTPTAMTSRMRTKSRAVAKRLLRRNP